jgi:hypothetical protein
VAISWTFSSLRALKSNPTAVLKVVIPAVHRKASPNPETVPARTTTKHVAVNSTARNAHLNRERTPRAAESGPTGSGR